VTVKQTTVCDRCNVTFPPGSTGHTTLKYGRLRIGDPTARLIDLCAPCDEDFRNFLDREVRL
jgi:hypothetical protein